MKSSAPKHDSTIKADQQQRVRETARAVSVRGGDKEGKQLGDGEMKQWSNKAMEKHRNRATKEQRACRALQQDESARASAPGDPSNGTINH